MTPSRKAKPTGVCIQAFAATTNAVIIRFSAHLPGEAAAAMSCVLLLFALILYPISRALATRAGAHRHE